MRHKRNFDPQIKTVDDRTANAPCLLRGGAKDRETILSWLATGNEFGAPEAVEAGLLDFVSR